jgi:signal transduction histidine kinase
MLQDFIAGHHEEIVSRCRAKVATRSVPPPTAAEIDHGVPLFLEQLVHALRFGLDSSGEIATGATQHGHDLLLQGFTISQVVHDYGDVCQSVTELAVETGTDISAEDFRVLNACLDNAIAGAVTQFGRERQRSDVEGESARGTERLGFLAHELRNLVNAAIVAFHVLKTGNVGIGGSTGAVLYRSLMGLDTLIARSLAEVRLTWGAETHERFPVALFIQELEPAATLSANARDIKLVVLPVGDGMMIEADRQVLTAVVGNLLQNAFKFTRPHTTVTLRVGGNDDRVLIQIEDECGGLGSVDGQELFRPFEQRSADPTGCGLGLAFSRAAVEANHGRIYARSVPGKGCVFTVDLPRLPVSVIH